MPYCNDPSQPWRGKKRSDEEAARDMERYTGFAHRCVAKLRKAIGECPESSNNMTKEEFEKMNITQMVSLNSESGDVNNEGVDALHNLYKSTAGQKTAQHDHRGKHSAQIEAITSCVIGVLSKQGRLGNEKSKMNPVVVELGAGRGLLGKLISNVGKMDLTVVERREIKAGFEEAEKEEGDVDAEMKVPRSSDIEMGDASPDASTEAEELSPKELREAVAQNENNSGDQAHSRITQDIADLNLRSVTGERPVVLLAKHLCASASDIAVKMCAQALTTGGKNLLKEEYECEACDGEEMKLDSIPTEDKSSLSSSESVPPLLFALAPCCHHTDLAYETYSGREWWESNGLTNQEFSLCKQLIFLSKIPTIHDMTCRRWKLRQVWGAEDLKRIGLLARRVLEEGRLQHLKKIGREKGQEIHTLLVEYCIPSLSPDNLLLLASTDPIDSSQYTSISGGPNDANSEENSNMREESGALLTLVPEAISAGQAQRVTEFLLENRMGLFQGLGGCHVCDLPIGMGRTSKANDAGTEFRQVLLKSTTSKANDAGTEFRQVLLKSTVKKAIDGGQEEENDEEEEVAPAWKLFNQIQSIPFLASCFDRYFPFERTFELEKLEELFVEPSADKTVSKECQAVEEYVSKILREKIGLHYTMTGLTKGKPADFNLKLQISPKNPLLNSSINFIANKVLEELNDNFSATGAVARLCPSADYTHTFCMAAWRGLGSKSNLGIALADRETEFDPLLTTPEMRLSRKDQKAWNVRLKEMEIRAESNELKHEIFNIEKNAKNILAIGMREQYDESLMKGNEELNFGEIDMFEVKVPGARGVKSDHEADKKLAELNANASVEIQTREQLLAEKLFKCVKESKIVENTDNPVVLVDLGQRSSWDRPIELCVQAFKTVMKVKEEVGKTNESSSRDKKFDPLVVCRVTATEVSKLDVKRHLKGWQGDVTANLFRRITEEMGREQECGFQILHLLTDGGNERTLVLKKKD